MPIALQKDQEMAAHWKTQIEQCDKSNNKWFKRAEKISKNYRDERDDQDKGAAKRLNLFWSNVQTLKPAIYSKTPVPICERRFLDKDTTGRVASTILERALRYEVAMSGFDATVRRARNDYLTGPGRGQAWVRYDPKFGEPISPKQTAEDDITDDAGEPLDKAREEETETQEREFLAESLGVDYVHWQDFYIFPANARTWVEVEGVGRRLYMSRSDMEDNDFNDWKTIQLDHVPKMDGNQGAASTVSGQEGIQATVFEIWWKPERKVYFVAKSHTKICKEADDPLKLEKFFPCPEPLSATMTNDTMIPVPDYAESQDQYIQIDELTKRIDILTAACKVVGVYDAAAQSLKRVFEEAQEPNLIAVDSWAMFAEKGGLKGAIDWVPIEQVAKALQIIIEVRTKIIEDLDRTTGISDIMRGTSDARETMGGQRLKSNNSSTRLQERQDDMARFCRDIICIMGEIISEHYSPETLLQVSGALYDEGLDPPPVPAPPPNPMMGHNGGPPLQSPPIPAPAMMPPQGQSPPPVPAGPQPMPGSPPGMIGSQPAPPQAAPAGEPPPDHPMGLLARIAAGLERLRAQRQQAPAAPPGAPPPEDNAKMQRKMELIASAIALLRQDKLRGFRIDIETDSTVAGDAQQEKAQRIEFVEGVTKFIETAGQVTATMPEFAPLAAKMLGFAVRGFRVGRDLESAIEEFCDKAEMQAKENAANPKPSPEMMKVQGEIEAQKVEAASEAQNSQMETQRKQMEIQSAQQIKQMEIHIKQIDVQIEEMKAQAEIRSNDLKAQQAQREDYYHAQKHQRETEKAEREHQRALELGEVQHRQALTAAKKPANGASA